PGLGKALVAFGKCEEKDRPGRLKALDEIHKQAEALKKEHKKEAEVASYLDEVIKETVPSRKAIEATKEDEGEKDENDEEAEEYKKDLKKKLITALAQVKSRAPGENPPAGEPEPQLGFMAYVAGRACAVLIARKVG